MNADMVKKIREWLGKHGYPLEMQAAAAFRKAGFTVYQSVHYIDPETQKGREIDLLASDEDLLGVFNIHLAIECKASRNPWILFGSEAAGLGKNILFSYAIMRPETRGVFLTNMFDEPLTSGPDVTIPMFNRLKWLKKRGIKGYAVRQAFEDKDNSYAASFSVVKAASYFVNAPEKTHVICFPIIVIDAPLLVCHLDAAGEISFDEVTEGEFFFSSNTPSAESCCIRVVTSDRLESFAKDAWTEMSQLRRELKEDETKVGLEWGLGADSISRWQSIRESKPQI